MSALSAVTEDFILPKAATREKPTAKTAKPTTNGSGKADQGVNIPKGKEFVEVDEAIARYEQRKASQLNSIKKIDKKLLREMLHQMVLGRRFEEKCAEVYRMGKIGGFCHLYIGQEAIGVGAMTALEPKDMVITADRDHVLA